MRIVNTLGVALYKINFFKSKFLKAMRYNKMYLYVCMYLYKSWQKIVPELGEKGFFSVQAGADASWDHRLLLLGRPGDGAGGGQAAEATIQDHRPAADLSQGRHGGILEGVDTER